tara:strand:+ start:286 stop:435 length:150 start_codon:yes stop_codon:yes gene_type:complete
MATEVNKDQRFNNISDMGNTITNASSEEQTTLISKSNTVLGYIVSDLLT